MGAITTRYGETGTRLTLAAVATAPSGTVSLEMVAVSGAVGAQESIRHSASRGRRADPETVPLPGW